MSDSVEFSDNTHTNRLVKRTAGKQPLLNKRDGGGGGGYEGTRERKGNEKGNEKGNVREGERGG